MRDGLIGVLLLISCTTSESETDGETDAIGSASLVGIGVSPRDVAVGVGDTVRFRVQAFYDDASTVDVSEEVSWVTTEPRVAEIDASGLATARAPGVAGIVATDARGVSTRTDLVVRGAADAPTRVSLSPRLVDLRVGEHVALAAVGTWPDGTTGNLAWSCAWSVDDAVAEIEAGGRLTGTAEGRTTARASCGALDASAPVTIRPADARVDLPDLVVGEVLFEVTGDTLFVVTEVGNVGDGMSPLGFVDLFLDSDGAPDGDDLYVATDIIEALAPGESALVELGVDALEPGSHDAWVFADADGWIEEADEGNNASGPLAFQVE